MKEIREGKFVIISEFGLHARASANLVKLASKYKSDIFIEKEGKVVDGKNILGVISLLGVKGSIITVRVQGEDAKEAFEEISEFIKSGLGEGCNPLKFRKVLKGIGVSPNVVTGKAYLWDNRLPEIPKYRIPQEFVEREIRRFLDALDKTKKQFQEAKELYLKRVNHNHIVIFDAYILMLEDKDMVREIKDMIKKERINAEWAVFKEEEKVRKLFEEVKDGYIRERMNDISFVSSGIICNLLKNEYQSLSAISTKVPTIVVAYSLSPTELLAFTKGEIKGFITETGSPISHTAILAGSLELPGILGVEGALKEINGGDKLIVDSKEGIVIVNPEKEDIRKYKVIVEKRKRITEQFYSLRMLPAITQDGVRVNVRANLELPEEAKLALDYGAEGVGLYRTEFLYLNNVEFSDEERQFCFYKDLAEKIYPHPVVLRAFDIGGEKNTPLSAPKLNPVLGLRAIRFALKQPEIFIAQFKAMLRASLYGNIKIMLPFIGEISELEDSLIILEEAKERLRKENKPFKEDVELGCMIELPSAVMVADLLTERVNFFSIGTNDLIQYALGIDRTNEQLAYLYHPLHLSILRMIKRVVEVAKQKGIAVSICGAMAEEPLYIPVLLGLGLKEISITYGSIPKVKYIIRNISLEECEKLVKNIFEMKSYKEIEEFVFKKVYSLFPDIFEKEAQ